MSSSFVVDGAVGNRNESENISTDRRRDMSLTSHDAAAAAAVMVDVPQQRPPLQHIPGGKQSPPVAATMETALFSTEIPGMKKLNTFPFSEDLVRILKEVAVKGSSSVLPWKHDDVVWKRPESRTSKDIGGLHTTNRSAVSIQQDSAARRHHDYYAQTRHSRGSHKRARLSTISSRHLHGTNRSHYSSSGNSNSNNNNNSASSSSSSSSSRNTAAATTSSTTTMTTTMVVEPKSSVTSLQKAFSNGAVQQPTGTTSGLFVLRPQSSSSSQHPTSMYQNSLFLPSSSTGRTTASIASYTAASGSEHEDTSQYECDSEGTSATSNSEMSFNSSISKRRGIQTMGNIGSRANLSLTIAKRTDPVARPQYMSVRDALVSALTLVLDHYYYNRGGYKLSPLEKRIYDIVAENNDATKDLPDNHESSAAATDPVRNSEEVFQKRKKRLLEMLGKYCNAVASDHENSDIEKGSTVALLHSRDNTKSFFPPFTIQRLAEVLMEPERYYSQTHKLCNCLEKLLLVTSSATAFGGSIGGGTTPSRQEATEIAALSEERKRLRSEFRQRHKKSRRSSNTTETHKNDRSGKVAKGIDDDSNKSSTPGETRTDIPDADADDDDDDELVPVPPNATSDPLDAAARAALRSKFDHVGIDPHSQAAIANSRDVMALMESRRLTNTSPPPPSLNHSVLQHQLQLHPRQSSPLRSSPSPSSSPESSKAMLSPRIPSPLLFHNINNHGHDGSPTLSPLVMTSTLSHSMNLPFPQHPHQHHPNLNLPSAAMLSAHNNNHPIGASMYHGDSSGSMETHKSSSASSDLDSESDIDDSASDDRSDGSDNERPSYEPLTAAQAMALNRRHQQARMQSRLLTAAATQQQQQQSSTTNNNYSQSSGIMDGYHHRPNNTESPTSATAATPAPTATTTTLDYQCSSGDSMDSTRAEDSGGSDSSSSDQAD